MHSVPVSRRRVLAGLGGAAAAALLAPQTLLASAIPTTEQASRPRNIVTQASPRHLAWVWQFARDGDPYEIRDTLAAHGMGIAVKTHDGSRWMGTYDRTPTSVRSARTVEALAKFFEQGGVPFHAWAVVKGRQPEREARLASQVLDAGARTLFLDLESYDGFWEGTRRDAWIFGEALRRKHPGARISTTIDARPWEFPRIPLDEFAAFSDELAPQVYWSSFTSDENVKRYRQTGDIIGKKRVTPTLVVEAAVKRLSAYQLPIHPIGDGTVTSSTRWREFLRVSYASNAQSVSVWRYGVMNARVFKLLRDTPPQMV